MQRRRWIGSRSLKACAFGSPGSSVRATNHVLPVIPVNNKEKKMLKKQTTLLFALVLTFLLAAVFAHQAPAQAKEARWEGRVIRISKENSSLTVRKSGGSLEKTCVY